MSIGNIMKGHSYNVPDSKYIQLNIAHLQISYVRQKNLPVMQPLPEFSKKRGTFNVRKFIHILARDKLKVTQLLFRVKKQKNNQW